MLSSTSAVRYLEAPTSVVQHVDESGPVRGWYGRGLASALRGTVRGGPGQAAIIAVCACGGLLYADWRSRHFLHVEGSCPECADNPVPAATSAAFWTAHLLARGSYAWATQMSRWAIELRAILAEPYPR